VKQSAIIASAKEKLSSAPAFLLSASASSCSEGKATGGAGAIFWRFANAYGAFGIPQLGGGEPGLEVGELVIAAMVAGGGDELGGLGALDLSVGAGGFPGGKGRRQVEGEADAL
jgi:hypothetical protein